MDRMNVVYASDDCYASLAGVSMLSLFENNKDCVELCVYVLSDRISNCNLSKLREIGRTYQRKVDIIDISEALNIFAQKGAGKYANESGGGYAAYAKLLIPDLIPGEQRIIYLDCDTLVLGSIADLTQVSLNEKPLGMAQDCIQNRYKKFISLHQEKRYFNSGVIVFDTFKWKENRCMERMLWHLEHIRNDYPLPDQDLINVVLQDDIYCLSMKYNFLSQYFLYSWRGLMKVYDLQDMYFYKDNEYVEAKSASVLHFCGQTFIRPWYCNSRHPAKKKYDHYYNLSPWKDDAQDECMWAFPYKIQYLLYRYAPDFVSVLAGCFMQSLFMRLTYKV